MVPAQPAPLTVPAQPAPLTGLSECEAVKSGRRVSNPRPSAWEAEAPTKRSSGRGRTFYPLASAGVLRNLVADGAAAPSLFQFPVSGEPVQAGVHAAHARLGEQGEGSRSLVRIGSQKCEHPAVEFLALRPAHPRTSWIRVRAASTAHCSARTRATSWRVRVRECIPRPLKPAELVEHRTQLVEPPVDVAPDVG
jgi:hypothetical protein